MKLFHRMSLLSDDTVHSQGNYNSNDDENTSTLITEINSNNEMNSFNSVF